MRLPVDLENEKKRREIAAYAVKHLPIVKDYAKKIGLVEIINNLIPSEMDIDPGTVFLGLILDTLSGRTPLYRLDEFFETQDTELLLGKYVSPDKFSDHNVARVLDKAYEIGSIKIFSAISRNAAAVFEIEGRHVSFDTTSLSVHGDYAHYSDKNSEHPFLITFGKSKDHRPDLKQFLISMLCVDRNVPIFGNTEDGNGSDKNINNRILSEISQRMTVHGLEPGAYIYIADSALVTPKNLDALGEDILFITRLPANYGECNRVIKEAIEKDEWEDLGVLAVTKPTVNRPAARYKAHESEVELYGTKYRAVVIHSSAHDKRRQKRIDREVNSEYKKLQDTVKKAGKKVFHCDADARVAAEELRNVKKNYHTLRVVVEERPKYKVGRPKDGIREVREMRYGLSVKVEKDDEARAMLRKEVGCFVMLTNVPEDWEEGYDAKAILKAYKDQHGIEQNFAFLKDPAIINGIFLKKAERIEILGLVLLLSLLIWRLIERSMRKHVEETERDLPGWKKRRTKRPTSFMLVTKFLGVTVIKNGQGRKLNNPLTDQQKEYLKALNVNPKIFVNPKAG
jgi:transposase